MTETNSAAPLDDIRSRIAKAAVTAGRATVPELIAVSKTRTVAAIEPLLAAGQRSFGENRVQEAAEKWPALRKRHPDVRLHLIGQLQSNKAADAVPLFDVIHSLDRPSLIDALGAACTDANGAPDCFVQVNIGGEAQKGGCAIDAIGALIDRARGVGLRIVGLMCLPPAELEPAPYFALLAKLARDHGLAELSMGMSDDFETAVTLGATQVRIGSALFGPRA